MPEPDDKIDLRQLCLNASEMVDLAANQMTEEQILPNTEATIMAESLTHVAADLRDAVRALTPSEDALDGKFTGVIIRNKDGRIEPSDGFVVFVARDNAFLATLFFYREECRRQGCEQPQLGAVDTLIRRVRDWRTKNPDKVKLPDVHPGELSWEKK